MGFWLSSPQFTCSFFTLPPQYSEEDEEELIAFTYQPLLSKEYCALPHDGSKWGAEGYGRVGLWVKLGLNIPFKTIWLSDVMKPWVYKQPLAFTGTCRFKHDTFNIYFVSCAFNETDHLPSMKWIAAQLGNPLHLSSIKPLNYQLCWSPSHFSHLNTSQTQHR